MHVCMHVRMHACMYSCMYVQNNLHKMYTLDYIKHMHMHLYLHTYLRSAYVLPSALAAQKSDVGYHFSRYILERAQPGDKVLQDAGLEFVLEPGTCACACVCVCVCMRF